MVVVALAELKHVKPLAVLLEEMDRHYGTTEFEPLEQRVAQITDALFGPIPAGFALLAWKDEQLVGLVSYSFLWPAVGVTRSLYLKELYVAQEHRREGIGKLLMNSIFDVATKHGCSRVEWTTDQESQGAQCFYQELGMLVNVGKLFYRVELGLRITAHSNSRSLP